MTQITKDRSNSQFIRVFLLVENEEIIIMMLKNDTDYKT